MAIAFSDIAKQSNDIASKDFFHSAPVAVEVKTTAPNGVTFTAKGKNSTKGAVSASIESKFVDKETGLTVTQGWANNNALSTKLELANALAPGLKSELVSNIVPGVSKSVKLNNYYTQDAFNVRAFVDIFKGPTFNGDFTFGKDGFTTGASLSYDIKAAALTGYSAGIGYKKSVYALSLIAANNLSVFTAGYYHKVSPVLEVGAKGTYDSKSTSSASPVAIEFASKYALDSTAFVKAKIADSGVLTLAYQQVLSPGVKLGLGGAFDTLKLNESAHKLGLSLTFSA